MRTSGPADARAASRDACSAPDDEKSTSTPIDFAVNSAWSGARINIQKNKKHPTSRHIENTYTHARGQQYKHSTYPLHLRRLNVAPQHGSVGEDRSDLQAA